MKLDYAYWRRHALLTYNSSLSGVSWFCTEDFEPCSHLPPPAPTAHSLLDPAFQLLHLHRLRSTMRYYTFPPTTDYLVVQPVYCSILS